MKPHVTVARRMAIIWIFATLPLLGTSIFYIVFYANREIAFTRSEMAGAPVLAALDPLIDLLHEHHVLAAEGPAERLRANEAAMRGCLARLRAAVAGLSSASSVRVSARDSHRVPVDLAPLISQIASVCEPARAAGGQPGGDEAALALAVKSTMRRVGNSSNLILDTDLDSYSLVDLLVYSLPRGQERLTRLEELGRSGMPTGSRERVPFATASAIIEEMDAVWSRNNLRTAIDENRNTKGGNARVQGALSDAMERFMGPQERLIETLRRIGDGSQPPVSVAEFERAIAQAREANADLWMTSSKALDEILGQRLGIYLTYRAFGFGFIALSLLSSTAVAALAGRSLIAQQRAERKVQMETARLNAELERRVAERTTQLTATVSELEAFSYSVSHDLRNPLRAVDGFSLVLLEDYADRLDETARDYLMRIRRGSQRMGLLIDDLLKLSRLSRVEMTLSRVDLSDMAVEIVEQLRTREPDRKVAFVCQAGLTAFGDPSLVQAVLVNLFENAWKYTRRRESAQIEFYREAEVAASGAPVFAVKDNGVGFDMRYSSKLFTAFQRLHSASEFEGTGIGLATVKRILLRHGGQIRAVGQVGGGACFYFSFSAAPLT